MLVTLKNILRIAEARGCAVGSFNTPNMATLRAVLQAAEELGEPVVVMHAQIHEEMGLCKMEEIVPVMRLLADRASVPVCVHLDHGTDLSYLRWGLDLGCTSVMYDGSAQDPETNCANTCIAREISLRYGASLEAEIGSMGARESAVSGNIDESLFTDPADAEAFVNRTGVDALACAFGTAHGLYIKQPKLDFERLAKIRSMVNVPLVMHGGSGVSTDDYRKVISLGIRKINYYTYMAKAGGAAVQALADQTFFHDIEIAATEAMKQNAKSAMAVFGGRDLQP